VQSKDSRFDGWFVTGVVTTGIYCRPSCPVVPPEAEKIRFHPTPASAQSAGFRDCKRCRPDLSPASPEWNARTDVVARAVKLIADGVVDREGVAGLSNRLGYSRRQLERLLRAELGAGPSGLARAQRAQTARLLLETTDLPLADIALAAGFGSVRQFNDTVRRGFATTPSDLQGRRCRGGDIVRGTLVLRLPFRTPLFPGSLFGHLAATAVPGVEEWRDGAYRRAVSLPHGTGLIELSPASDHVRCAIELEQMRDLGAAIARCRRLLDLDADPVAIDAALAEDRLLAPLVAQAPGRRVPGTVDEAEFAVRAVLGQQVSTAAARTHAGRLAARLGKEVSDERGGLSRLFPTPAAIAEIDPAALRMPAARARAVVGLARRIASGDIDLAPGCDREAARRRLAELPGIGPWTVETVAMRALKDPDAFPPTDLGVVAAARAAGLGTGARLLARSARWRPWRAYAVQHLWATQPHSVNEMPGGGAA
jgi:AraC family transcriptional regulator of adaptative response / DNA-3-methyladenine glycosylase II